MTRDSFEVRHMIHGLLDTAIMFQHIPAAKENLSISAEEVSKYRKEEREID